MTRTIGYLFICVCDKLVDALIVVVKFTTQVYVKTNIKLICIYVYIIMFNVVNCF